MDEKHNGNNEISASSLLDKLRRDIEAESDTAEIPEQPKEQPAKEEIQTAQSEKPSADTDFFAALLDDTQAPVPPKKSTSDEDLEQLIRKYLGDNSEQPEPDAEGDAVDIDAALDEILVTDTTVGKESVRADIRQEEQRPVRVPEKAPAPKPEEKPVAPQPVFEDDDVVGAIDSNIPLYDEFEVKDTSGETGVGDDFDIPIEDKSDAEAIKPAEPVAAAIPAIDVKPPVLSPLEQLKVLQTEDGGDASSPADEKPADSQSNIEEAQLREFLEMYDSDDSEVPEETPEGAPLPDDSRMLNLNENGEVDVDSVPENWADLEADEEPLATPDLNGDGKFDQTDLDLMAAFGVDDSLKEVIGDEQIDELKTQLEIRNQQHLDEMEEGRTRGESLLQTRAEYVSAAQNKEFFAKYKVKYMRLLRQLGLGILCTMILFVIENYSLLHITLPKFMNPETYQTVYTLIDFQFVLFSVALVWNSTRFSFKSMLHKKPMPESITGIMFFVSLVYTVTICILAPVPKLCLFNFPVALCALLHQFYRYMRFRREIMSFKIVSSKKQKYVIDALPAKEAALEMEAFQDYIPDDPLMFKIRRASFVDGFYERMDTYPRSYRILGVIFPVAFLLAVAFFAVQFILTKDMYSALNTAYITLFCCMPIMSYISLAQPLYVASRIAYKHDSAIIGESSLGEYANASIISFDDRDVFPPENVTVKNVKVYGNNRIDHVLYYTASVANMLGGPLGDIFTIAAKEVGYSEDTQIRLIDDNGTEATVDGKTVIIGKADFLMRYGYDIVLTEEERQMELSHEKAIMYLSYGDELTAKMYIEYHQDDGFEKILKQLYHQGMCVAIKTYDPNINDALLAAKINIAKYPVKIIKCHQEAQPAKEEDDKISTGVVSKSSAKYLLHTLSMCDKISGVLRVNSLFKIIATVVAMLGMAAIVLLGYSLQIPSFWVALYQLVWLIPVIIVGRFKVN